MIATRPPSPSAVSSTLRPAADKRSRTVVLDTRVVTGSGGGPDKTILNSPRYLERAGYHMLCGYLHPPGDPGFEVLRGHADRYNAPLISIPDRGPWDWRVLRQLIEVCRRESVSIWHGHDYKTNALGLLLKRFHPMRLVTTLHGWVHHTARTPLYYRIDRAAIQRYERVLCVSPDLLESCLAQGIPAHRCILLENGIDTSDYIRKHPRPDARKILDLPQQGELIGAIGRLEPEKGFDTLILALSQVLAQGVDTSLVILGEGSDRTRLQGIIDQAGLSGRVFLPGWAVDVRPYLEAMDLYVLSSLREGLPNVVLEAMAYELPIVATAVNGVPRLVQHGSNGLLIPPAEPVGMASAILKLLQDPPLRQKLGQAARNTVETRYSFATRMTRLQAIYDEMLAEGEPEARHR